MVGIWFLTPKAFGIFFIHNIWTATLGVARSGLCRGINGHV